MFENFTRKATVFALLVWGFVVVWRAVVLGESVGLTDIATSAALIIAVAAGKSVATQWVATPDTPKPPALPPTNAVSGFATASTLRLLQSRPASAQTT